jgi:hypothetical protein
MNVVWSSTTTAEIYFGGRPQRQKKRDQSCIKILGQILLELEINEEF